MIAQLHSDYKRSKEKASQHRSRIDSQKTLRATHQNRSELQYASLDTMKLLSALVLLTLAAVSVQGFPSSEFPKPNNATAFPLSMASNTTMEAVECIDRGSYGGGGGGAFNDFTSNTGSDCGTRVSKITIRSGRRVDAIQLTYRLSNGNTVTGPKHGGNGGGQTVYNIDIAGGEEIVYVGGRSGSRVDRLEFVTNKGRILGPHGGGGGGAFAQSQCKLRGIYGRSGNEVDRIGFYCSPPLRRA